MHRVAARPRRRGECVARLAVSDHLPLSRVEQAVPPLEPGDDPLDGGGEAGPRDRLGASSDRSFSS
jgi:hypothetical protein